MPSVVNVRARPDPEAPAAGASAIRAFANRTVRGIDAAGQRERGDDPRATDGGQQFVPADHSLALKIRSR
jgi:hypothetical protein